MRPAQISGLARWTGGTKSSLIGILVNLGLAVTKCTAGLLGHSFALVADGLESGADVPVVSWCSSDSSSPLNRLMQTALMGMEKPSDCSDSCGCLPLRCCENDHI
jgi:hypothetical protein